MIPKFQNTIFPHPSKARKDGLLAYGGNLTVETLLNAYSLGIFPWYGKGSPILWWSPDPRMVLFPHKLNISKSLKRVILSEKFQIRFDTRFCDVVKNCSIIEREGQDDTWITDDMLKAYCELHEIGYAHSVEAFFEDKLVGGLYGVSLGRAFFGESMFHVMTDASKVAFYHLIELLKSWQFELIDAQVKTDHLMSLGAEEIPRTEFLIILEKCLSAETKRGRWASIK